MLPSQWLYKDEPEFGKGPDHDLSTPLRTTTRNRVRRGRSLIWIPPILTKSWNPWLCYSNQGYTPTKPFQSTIFITHYNTSVLGVAYLAPHETIPPQRWHFILWHIPLVTWAYVTFLCVHGFFRFFQSIMTFSTPAPLSYHTRGCYELAQAPTTFR